MSMRDAITMILMAIGAVFAFVGSLGILRLPDLYMRMSASAKASTLGVGCLLAAAAVHFDDLALTSRTAAVIVLSLATAPVAAHMIGRAAYFTGVPLWEKSVCDDLREQRDAETGSQGPPDSR
jgi:multicomponent Na+:H+ antiporter subunit G